MRKKQMRRLSKDFVKEVSQDKVKKCIVPGKWLLEAMLVWPDTDEKYVTVINWLFFLNLIIVEIFHAAYVVVHRSDIGNAIMAAATVTTTFECLVRFYIIAFKKPEINDIIFKIWRKFWPVMVVSPKKMEQLIRKCYTALILTVGCYGPAILCNSIATLWPYLSNRELILRSVYPFDWNQTYVYEVIYIWQYVTQWYILILVNTFDFFMIPVVMVCTVQFGILQDVFKNILSQKSRRQRLLIFGDVISDRDMILRCLDHQQMLISICNQLEEIFRFAILFQFVTSTAALCSSALMLQVDSSHFMEMLTFVIAHMFQLFYYCFVGSELISYSENMANAIYKCNWHLSDNREFMKALTLILQRCQKPQRLTAVGIVDLNFVSYLTVLRVAFSFYTLLTKVIDRGTSWT